MSEWARGGLDNINSVLPGFTRNPYNTAYATGGSSGGTGAGLAASFGVVGLGSDTWGSIRNPSSNNALVGLRTSWALVSRAGMIGLYDARDTAGPMAGPSPIWRRSSMLSPALTRTIPRRRGRRVNSTTLPRRS